MILPWMRSISGQTGHNEKYFEDGYGHRYGLLNGWWAAGVSQADLTKYPGANGNSVSAEISASGSVSTNGHFAPAVILESIGGAGLDGATYQQKLPGSGAGGTVTFVNKGVIVTDGPTSTAVLLQSVGGRGGKQLFMVSSSDYSGDAGGGAGGIGGNGGDVEAIQLGTIETKQNYSFGLAAFSIGGAGGDGASAFGARTGGNGGAAGNGGTVKVVNDGRIITAGEGAVAILAQSLGGGDAANAFQRTDITPTTSGGGGAGGGSTSVFFGGSQAGVGGAGGNGGLVEVTNNGVIATKGDSAYGILAQSVGGGGGAGGNAKSAFSILLGSSEGGDGGGGGNGGKVTIKRSTLPAGLEIVPTITTLGKGASGILAQSVGGGGGTGGTAKATTVGAFVSVSVAVGGAGGKGGFGDTVSVDNTSNIITSGIEAHGIEARSVGGGGGKGGDASASAYAAAASPPGYPSVAISFSTGGSGGGGGNGGRVEVTNEAIIKTSGSKANGILATSVGGGGGSGGAASSLSDMFGLYKNLAITVALGGTAGGGGAGGSLIAINKSDIETSGAFADGILATSIGGGGGTGGNGETKTAKGASWSDSVSKLGELLPVADTFSVNLSVGGSGGSGGSGERVDVGNEKSILTKGEDSRGIVAQSVGGGGGNAGGYLAGGDGEYAIRASIGGSGGKGGAGGYVQVNNAKSARIETRGGGSAGIFAQSVGGGGGIGGAFSGKTKSPVSIDEDGAGFALQLADELFKLNKQAVKNYEAQQNAEKATAAKTGAKSYEARDKEMKDLLNKKGSLQEKISYAKDIFSTIKSAVNSAKADVARNEKIGKDRKAGKEIKNEELTAAQIAVRAFYEGGKSIVLSKLYDQFADHLKDALKAVSVKGQQFSYNASINMTIGGTGGDGGTGGNVAVYNDGAVATLGETSIGIIAQSIGGGGGAGGNGVAAGTNRSNLNIAVGGAGSAAGNGGNVTVTNSGTIATEKGGSIGILAQSIGGGGGLGAVASNSDAVTSVSASVKVGGSAGPSSDGGKVEVVNSGTIVTNGKGAHGIVAQSIGGGGGAVTINRKDPLNPTVITNFAVTQEGLEDAYDLLKDLGVMPPGGTQDLSSSILGLPSASLNIGGNGGGGGSGSNAVIRHSGAIVTEGQGAFGIFAQSIGGGGGFGADVTEFSPVTLNLNFGGTGGTGGNGGQVFVVLGDKSSIVTKGDGSAGIFAQSIGGGGGYGGTGVGAKVLGYAEPVTEHYGPFGIFTANSAPRAMAGRLISAWTIR